MLRFISSVVIKRRTTMEFTEFKIVGVDKDHIEKYHTMENAFKYSFVLSGKPDDLWVKFLHHSYRMSTFGKKRQYSVMDNMIVLSIYSDDNMQIQLDYIKELVRTANDEYRR